MASLSSTVLFDVIYGQLSFNHFPMSPTPNDQVEPNKDGNIEDVADTKTAIEPGRTTEPEQEEAEEGISPDEFANELNKKPSEANAPKDFSASSDHDSKMLIASARISALAEEEGISKDRAAIKLIDEGIIKEDQANYLFKRDFGVQKEEPTQSISKDQIKAEMRAEDKLLSAVKGKKVSKQDAQRLIDDYRNLAQKNSPEEAAEFALYRAGITTKQLQDEAFKQGQDTTGRPPRGSSPTTPKPQPKSIDSSSIDGMSLEEYENLENQEIQELQDLQNKGLA